MEIGMNLPVMAPGLDRDTFLQWCERIDAGFFASIAAGERISFYNPDMTAALAAAAALTNRVKVVSGVFVPMLHHPVMLAKQLATIDVLSGGRFVAGLGVGGREQDYQSVDAPLGHRLTRLAQSVETMRSVWRGEPVVEGALPVGPTPVQEGGPKLLAGSLMVESIQAASKWADGLCGFSFGPSAAEMELQFEAARRAWKERDRPAPWLGTGFWYALGPKSRQQLGNGAGSVLFAKAGQGCSNIVSARELGRNPGILGSDENHLPEHTEGPKGDILQVTDWRAHHK